MRLARRYRLFIFDWDGTLLYMRLPLAVNEAIKRVLRLWNVPAPKELVDISKYDPKRALAREEMKNNALAFLGDLVFLLGRPKLHNDTLRILKKLKSAGKQIALFSNGRRYRLLKELAYLGITNYFDVIVSARDFGTTKPDPTGLKAVLYALKARPESAIYFGDMVDDVVAAKLARIHSCGVADGFDSYHTLKSARPEYLFRSTEELSKEL